VAGDRDTNLNKGNYNERIERDYLDNSILGNIGANTIIQNANNVVIKIEKDSEAIKSKLTTSSSTPKQPKKQDSTDNLNNQDFYINRPPIEENCVQEIEKAGALLCIKASEKMGKSLLLKKIFEEGAKKNYRQVKIDIQQLETASLSNYSTFLRWFCKRITRKLKLESCLEDYFEGFTPNAGCTDYFDEHILESLETPLLLGIDNIDRLAAPDFKVIAADFFGLLRSWYENRESNWDKLRLIVIYSTEDLPKLNLNQSPFNIGTKIELPDFEEKQVLELALRYNLDWSINEAQQLKELVGGHPYLVNHAIKSLRMNSKLTLSDILEKAATDSGIYADYLQNHLSTLEQEPALAKQLVVH